jgi:carnitine-CoA ligase
LYFADRIKDMLKVGGENVAASEIEAVIFAVEGVAEVAVVSMPHPMLDEVPAAFVVVTDAAPEGLLERITDACAARPADFTIPKLIRIVDTLPRATLEKVSKAELRAQLIAELESEADPHSLASKTKTAVRIDMPARCDEAKL